MKEKTKVLAGIILWVGVALCFAAAGISFLVNGGVESVASAPIGTSNIERVAPDSVGLDARHLGYIADKVEHYIANGSTEGAVVAVVRDGKLAYIEAFGNRERGGEAMTIDTRFDLASLTKPVVVSTAIMQLVERGDLRLEERVCNIIPEFKDFVDPKTKKTHHATIRDLMSHSSGLRAYVALSRLEADYPNAEIDKSVLLDYIAHSERLGAPGTISTYSCLNYILLGEIVERRTGLPLDVYAEQYIFEPLMMEATGYTPDAECTLLTAPTSPVGAEEELRGVVNDPLARVAMDGVSGNAGLFSTAEDLAIYCAMLLNRGEWNGAKILSPKAVAKLFEEAECDGSTRAMAWDRLTSDFEPFEEGDESAIYVHTGATGTSIHLDLEHSMAIIILTNRTHVEGAASDIKELRRSIATIVSYAVK